MTFKDAVEALKKAKMEIEILNKRLEKVTEDCINCSRKGGYAGPRDSFRPVGKK